MGTIAVEKTYRKKDLVKLLTDKAVMKRFPKVELHRHLEGSFPVDKLFQLATRNGLDVPKRLPEFRKAVQFPKDSEPDFLTFLAKFKTDWYRSYEDVEYITYHSVKELRRDGIFYIELRFSPEHFSLQNDFDRAEVTRIVLEAGNRAAREAEIEIRYLLTFNRNKQTSAEMLDLYDNLKKRGFDEIVGIDLAGDEINFPPDLFLDFFERVHSDGLYKATIHAGEVTSPTQIWEAVQKLNARRIGHGTQAINDPKLQEYLKENGIALEQCITSNYQTGSWPDQKNHPMGELYRRGVPVTINSDDPFIQDTDLTDDYIKAVRYFGFDLDDLRRLNQTALQASFVDEAAKARLARKYAKRFSRFVKENGL
jgi:adenosine deaminase